MALRIKRQILNVILSYFLYGRHCCLTVAIKILITASLEGLGLVIDDLMKSTISTKVQLAPMLQLKHILRLSQVIIQLELDL